MAIIRAAIGGELKEFPETVNFEDVWRFIDNRMSKSDVEVGIVLMDDSGATIGEIWESSIYYAHWETPSKMRAYFDLINFDMD